jgi:hypothetical protein
MGNINSEISFPKFVTLGCAQEKEKGEEGGKEGEEECTSCKNDQEVVFIQDLGFTVKVAAPGVEPFDIQVSSLKNGATHCSRPFSFIADQGIQHIGIRIQKG